MLTRAECVEPGVLVYHAWRDGVLRPHVVEMPVSLRAARIRPGDAVVLRVTGDRRIIEQRLPVGTPARSQGEGRTPLEGK